MKLDNCVKISIKKHVLYYRYIYLMALPVFIYYVVFHYFPIYGALIAFKDFNPRLGIIKSPWIGFENFISFFNSYYFWTVLRNTLLINIYDLLWGFPAPIIFALLLNEIRSSFFKRLSQTITYMPHFISLVVICGIIVKFTSSDGFITRIIGQESNLLLRPELFRTIFVSSGIWQQFGWGSIIYIAALSGIDNQLYEAAVVDGAKRFKQLIHITLPGIAPITIILLILRLGRMVNVGFEKVILLYNPLIYDTADVISSFVYRKGLLESDFSYASAVGLFNSIINFMFLLAANQISRKVSENSLW